MAGFDKGAKTNRLKQLQQVYKQTGRKPAKLEQRKGLDSELSSIWSIYLAIKTSYNVKITLLELKSYADMIGITLTPFEIESIMMIDRIHTRELNNG